MASQFAEHLPACSHQGSTSHEQAADITSCSQCNLHDSAGLLLDDQAAQSYLQAQAGNQNPNTAIATLPVAPANINHASESSRASHPGPLGRGQPALSGQTIQDDAERHLLAAVAASAAATDAASACGPPSEAEKWFPAETRYGERAKLRLRPAQRSTKRPKTATPYSLTAQKASGGHEHGSAALVSHYPNSKLPKHY